MIHHSVNCHRRQLGGICSQRSCYTKSWLKSQWTEVVGKRGKITQNISILSKPTFFRPPYPRKGKFETALYCHSPNLQYTYNFRYHPLKTKPKMLLLPILLLAPFQVTEGCAPAKPAAPQTPPGDQYLPYFIFLRFLATKKNESGLFLTF